MKNFKIEHEGKEYWISRSLSVMGVIIAVEENAVPRVLAVKRGKGCPDFVGYWNCPCGYLDYDETLNGACVREIAEETGYQFKPELLNFFSINSSPLENRQNVSAQFFCFIKGFPELVNFEKSDETEEVKWIPVTELSDYDWAFNHQYIIANILEYGSKILSKQGDSGETAGTVQETPEPDSSN